MGRQASVVPSLAPGPPSTKRFLRGHCSLWPQGNPLTPDFPYDETTQNPCIFFLSEDSGENGQTGDGAFTGGENSANGLTSLYSPRVFLFSAVDGKESACVHARVHARVREGTRVSSAAQSPVVLRGRRRLAEGDTFIPQKGIRS